MEMITESYLTVAIIAYLVGSIPFGLILTKMAGKGDIRAIGSGNIGATNVLRTGSKKLAALTLCLDAGKGAAITLVIALSGTHMGVALAGIAVTFGHCFPLWLRFQGGKGVATSLAVFAAFDWRLGVLFCVVWLGTALALRFSSLAALGATMTCGIASIVLQLPAPIAIATLVLTGLIWTRHHQNIGRLLSGTEPKIGKK
jgi:glycerol-3-phosphate acyltransferase PlsY